tara:strand:- start:1608 stop:2060 length:453 start_codon:yes stop_codon:yes gene_type:complete
MDKKVYDKYIDIWMDTAPTERIAELEQQLLEVNNSNSTLHSLMLSGERRGYNKAEEHFKQKVDEANARVARLESVIRVTVTDMTKQSGNFNMYGRLDDALVESPAQSIALHDADVIDNFAVYYLSKTGSNIGFVAEQYSRQLRNSVKEGE